MAIPNGAAPAMAGSASENTRLQKAGGGAVNAAFDSFVADGLTPAMLDALRRRQADLFDAPVIEGPGMTIKALRRRGVIEGSRPVARLTPLGALVIDAAGLEPLGDGADA